MIKSIIKRDGKRQKFQPEKLTTTIYNAMTATGEGSEDDAKRIAANIIRQLERANKVPTVEEVQDRTEMTLMRNKFLRAAKAYIVYRKQHDELRDISSLIQDTDTIESYLNKSDWLVKENSNMTYSLQGLNNYLSSKVISNYWLQKLYPPEIRNAHIDGDIHLHDLGTLGAYCVGWDLADLLERGFMGVSGKVHCKPPKHLRSALGQTVNFLYTLQGEAAGAQAFSNVDTYFAPFIREDALNYTEVKQAIQEFIFSMNVPTRVGFQCLSEDTTILTPNGWKSYDKVTKGDFIYTYNVNEKRLEQKPVKRIFSKEYSGKMYSLRNRSQRQLISPNHRVVRQKFNSQSYLLQPIEDVIKYKTPISIPMTATNNSDDYDISDEQIKLMAWIIAEGTIEKDGSHRVSIYQKEESTCNEIKALLDSFGFEYSEREQKSLGTCKHIRLKPSSSKIVHSWLEGTKKIIPRYLYSLSKRQAQIFIETYILGDGYKHNNIHNITTTDKNILDGLIAIGFLAEYCISVWKRIPQSKISKKVQYIISLSRAKHDVIQKIEEVNYSGIIWSVNTDNETVIAKRKNAIFITGNTPFVNFTQDLKVPNFIKDEPPIVGGERNGDTFEDYQDEMDMFNYAFGEVMCEGDGHGNPFTFPIPTINITKDFDWDNDSLEPIWNMTSKYGIPYFSNFVNSDMSPDDVRSMCPLSGNEKVLIKSSRGRDLEYSSIRNIYEGSSKNNIYEVFSNGEFISGTFNKFNNQKMIEVELHNGHKVKMSESHTNIVLDSDEIRELPGRDLTMDMYLPYSMNVYNGCGGNRDIGFFVGCYAGDGSLDGDTAVIFSLNKNNDSEIRDELINISTRYFGANYSTYIQDNVEFLRINSRGAVGICKDYVHGKNINKFYNASVFSKSVDFRNGILEGHLATDGGTRNRIYTSSKRMVETLNMLAATLGLTTSIYKDDREGRLGKNPNYAVMIYVLSRQRYGDNWFKKYGLLWMKIKKIRKIPGSVAYCFESSTDNHMFTIGTTGILTHNCRLRLDNRELIKRGGGLFGANPLTGSIGVVTINMSRIGYLSSDADQYFERLDYLMDMAKDSLEIKRQVIENYTKNGLYPYSRVYLDSVYQRFEKYWQNHFSTIGVIGMNESLNNFMDCDIGSEDGINFAIEVMDHMRDRLAIYQEVTGNMYNLEATPAEGATYRLAKIDRAKYNDIHTANINGGEPYYTNSTQLPVHYTDNVFKALQLQDDLQCKYTGGTVMHIFLQDEFPPPEGVSALVKKVTDNFHLPYFTITPTFSVCPTHGYMAGRLEECPRCGTETEVYSRVVGYMRPVSQWNKGKVEEFNERNTFNLGKT